MKPPVLSALLRFAKYYPREADWLVLVAEGQISARAEQALRARGMFDLFEAGRQQALAGSDVLAVGQL